MQGSMKAKQQRTSLASKNMVAAWGLQATQKEARPKKEVCARSLGKDAVARARSLVARAQLDPGWRGTAAAGEGGGEKEGKEGKEDGEGRRPGDDGDEDEEVEEEEDLELDDYENAGEGADLSVCKRRRRRSRATSSNRRSRRRRRRRRRRSRKRRRRRRSSRRDFICDRKCTRRLPEENTRGAANERRRCQW